jgi:hypothetical protein
LRKLVVGKPKRCLFGDGLLSVAIWTGRYGRNADNRFCGTTCGWRYACSSTRRPAYVNEKLVELALDEQRKLEKDRQQIARDAATRRNRETTKIAIAGREEEYRKSGIGTDLDDDRSES